LIGIFVLLDFISVCIFFYFKFVILIFNFIFFFLPKKTDIQAMYLCEDVRAPNPPTLEVGDQAFSMLGRLFAEVDEDRQGAPNPDTFVQVCLFICLSCFVLF
jgi:hypothetical protein